jgi:hypothetical protein
LILSEFLSDSVRELVIGSALTAIHNVVNSGPVQQNQLPQARRKMGGVRRRSPGVRNRSHTFLAPQAISNCTQEVPTAGTKNESAADYNAAGISELHQPLAGEFHRSVNALWIRFIVLRVEAFFLAIKHVIRRYCHENGIDFTARLRQVFRTLRISRSGPNRIPLAAINVGPGCAINNCVGTNSRYLSLDQLSAGDIQSLMIEGKNFVTD